MLQKQKLALENKTPLRNIKLVELTDKIVTTPDFIAERAKHFYPSAASIKVGDKVIGACLRQSFYAMTGVPQTNPPTAKSWWKMRLGTLVEKDLVDVWKRGGFHVNNSVKFYNELINLSGELDDVLLIAGNLFCCEIKSIEGYYAVKEHIGTKEKPGYPKLPQLMQAFLYTWHFRDRLSGCKMYYIARDSGDQKEYTVECFQDGDDFFPMVDGIVDRRFPLSGIIKRYQELKEHLRNKTVPDRDFAYQMTDEQIEKAFKDGDLSTSIYETWHKVLKSKKIKDKDSRRPGNWQCSWCSWKNHCYSDVKEVKADSECSEELLQN